ncbi:MAG: diguanylate cyclase [Pseudohongiella sp.]|nr:diguanylate cyclase [Pseudohongiella sp.]
MQLTPVKSRISQILRNHHEFGNELVDKTFQRMFYLSAIAVPVTAAHVVIFSMLSVETEAQQNWRLGIIIYHSVMCLLFSLMILLTRPGRPKTLAPTARRLICTVSHAALLIAGVAVTAIDQLVTPSVTPFLVACTVAGVLFIVNPLAAVSLYSALFLLYSIALSFTQSDHTILVSNLVNGLTACSIAAGLSWLLWQQNIEALQQRNVIQRQQQKLLQSNRQLERLATRDELTGLVNRRMLQMLATEEQALMKRQGSSACLLLLDLDYFKNINDAYGHPAGDQLLQQLAPLLTQSVRGSDRVARWGGEEFGVLLRNTEPAQGLQVAENIRELIQQHRFELTDQNGSVIEIRMTASVGLAPLDAAETDMLGEAYRRADIALYDAKAGGRNRVVGSAL